LITLRYAENLASGAGLVFNPGERVLGTTTPLYTLFLALTFKCGLPGLAVGKAVNILADGALCLVVWRWLAGAGFARAASYAAAFIAVNPIQIQWAISGMEASLVAFCGTTVWMLSAERKTSSAWAIAGILFLLRWDGVLIAALLLAAAVIRE